MSDNIEKNEKTDNIEKKETEDKDITLMKEPEQKTDNIEKKETEDKDITLMKEPEQKTENIEKKETEDKDITLKKEPEQKTVKPEQKTARPEQRTARPEQRTGYTPNGRSDFRSNRDSMDFDNRRSKYKVYFKKKVCKFCKKRSTINYLEPNTLRRFTTERGRILPSRITGTCAKHQRRLSLAIKRARVLALLPFDSK